MFRPTQLELIARRIGESPLAACAAESYLERHGTPRTPAELLRHDLVGFDRSTLLIDAARRMGYALARDDFAIRTDSPTAGWLLLTAGLGIGFAKNASCARRPAWSRCCRFRPPPLEVWLTTHQELFTSRRIRAIYDRLAETLPAALRGEAATI